MTPLSNIITDRADTFSLSETLTRIEHDSQESIMAARQAQQKTMPEPTTNIELSQIKQALLDMRAQIDMIVSALDTELTPAQATPAPQQVLAPPVREEPYIPEHQYIPEPRQAAQPDKNEKPSYGYGEQRIVEGVFNGKQMIGEDGNIYEVPQNYASKSKMVEGDLLKLTITPTGKKYYKQVGPVARRTIMGELMQDPQGNWVVVADRIPYKILTASVTFHKARPGTKAVILVPEEGQASWGALDMFLS